MDIWSKQKRSEVMSKIRGTNTKPEIKLRSKLHRLGFRFRLHSKLLSGKPDIILKKYRTVIFVNGCFWHQHKKCIDGRVPSSNSKYWKRKLELNVIRDRKNIRKLRKLNWKVITIWECDLEKNLEKILYKIKNQLIYPC